jgi:hypothetical protein
MQIIQNKNVSKLSGQSFVAVFFVVAVQAGGFFT